MKQNDVFPTPVGVFPETKLQVLWLRSLPHARGGVSHIRGKGLKMSVSSPRPWGCFRRFRRRNQRRRVFPTPVGVFPKTLRYRYAFCCLPHARGGVSQLGQRDIQAAMSSPRPWGCFSKIYSVLEDYEVFPTPVGVFPPDLRPDGGGLRLPHARGGV